MQLSQKHETLSEFFFCIFQVYIKFYTFSKKENTLIAGVFTKLRAPKNVIK